MTLPEYLGTLPQQITAAGMVAILGLYARWHLGLKKLKGDSEADIRDHYAQELSALREKLNRQEQRFMDLEGHWRKMLEASDHRHEECEEARQTMRNELSAMHGEIAGLKRQLVRYSAERVVTLPGVEETHAAAAAERVRKIVDDEEAGGEVG